MARQEKKKDLAEKGAAVERGLEIYGCDLGI